MLLPLALVVVAYLILRAMRAGELFFVRVRDGRVEVRRGAITPALLRDLRDVAASAPSARGTVTATKANPRPVLVVAGLDERVAQRVRNVFGLHAHRVGSDASVRADSRSAAMENLVFFVLFGVALAIAVADSARLR